MKLAYVDQQHKDIDSRKSVYQVISGGNELIRLGNRDINARAYLSRFNFSGADPGETLRMLSGERNRFDLAMALKEEGNVLLLDEPTNDIDVNSAALEEGLDDFCRLCGGDQPRPLVPDRICTHILAFEGNKEVFFFEGSYSNTKRNKMKRLGNEEPNAGALPQADGRLMGPPCPDKVQTKMTIPKVTGVITRPERSYFEAPFW